MNFVVYATLKYAIYARPCIHAICINNKKFSISFSQVSDD
jgi:hypothetical protein